jgi:hypothetical protein
LSGAKPGETVGMMLFIAPSAVGEEKTNSIPKKAPV